MGTLKPAREAMPYMMKIIHFVEDTDEKNWLFTLACGHEVVSPVGPGVFTELGVLCMECLRRSNGNHVSELRQNVAQSK